MFNKSICFPLQKSVNYQLLNKNSDVQCYGGFMKLMQLAIGGLFTWIGADMLISGQTAFVAWLILFVGIGLILSGLFTTKNKSSYSLSSDSSGSSWGDSGGGDSGGGGGD